MPVTGPAAPRWVDTPGALDALVEEVCRESVYALDTEFHGERVYYPTLALVQLAWRGGIALIDPLAVDVRPLRRLLTGDATCVLFAASQDLAILERACDATPARLFDPQLASAFLGHHTPSLSKLLDATLGVRVDKGDQLGDWLRRPLPQSAARYAASDVEHLIALYDALREALAAKGRLAWAEEESERLRAQPHEPRDPHTAWWRVKGHARLRGRGPAIAQTLSAWREREARARNLPVRFVLSDMALLSMAMRPPRDADALRKVRGLDPRQLAGGAAEALLRALREGAALPASEVRWPPSDSSSETHPAALVALCMAWIAERATEEDIAASMLGTRADVTALLDGDAGSRLLTGFRRALVGDDLLALYAGRAAVTTTPSHALRMVPLSTVR